MSANVGTLLVEIGADVARLRQDMGKVQRTMNHNARKMQRSMDAVGVSIASALSVGAAVEFGRAVFDAGTRAEKLQKAFKAIEGAQAPETLAFLRKEAERLGLEFYTASEAFKSLSASAKGTALQGQASRDIFVAVSEAATVLGLNADETSGALQALSQMISKGKVQAEELRGQLGERLPGAFQMAARAMGVTTAELDKMLEKGEVTAEDLLPRLAKALHEEYGAAAQEAAKTGTAAFNRMTTAWTDFKASFYDSESVQTGIDSVTEALKGLTDVIEGDAWTVATGAGAAGVGLIGRVLFGSWGPGKIVTVIYAVNEGLKTMDGLLGKDSSSLGGIWKNAGEASQHLQKFFEALPGMLDGSRDFWSGELTEGLAKEAKRLQALSNSFANSQGSPKTKLDIGGGSGGGDSDDTDTGGGPRYLPSGYVGGDMSVVRDREQVWRKAAESQKEALAEVSKEYKRLTMGDTQFAIAETRARYEQLRTMAAGNAELVQQINEVEAAKIAEIHEDAANKARTAWEEYALAAQDRVANTEAMIASFGGTIEDSLTTAFTEGKFAAEDFFKTIYAEVIRMQVARPLAGAVTGGLGGAIEAIFHHDGGVVGSGGRPGSVPAAAFIGAPRYHSGGVAGLKPDEVPAILQRGEIVLSREQVAGAAAATSGSAPRITFNLINESGEPMSADPPDMRFDGEQWVATMVMRGTRNNTAGLRDFFRAGGAN
jgi:tape measure domain-containing protein